MQNSYLGRYQAPMMEFKQQKYLTNFLPLHVLEWVLDTPLKIVITPEGLIILT